MAKQSEWVKAVTAILRADMENSGVAAYRNGSDLREDAVILFAAKRYPRAAALAILAEEEFSKAFIILNCAKNGRWDSNIYLALRKHSHKQAMSEAMLDYLDWFSNNCKRVMALNQSSFVPVQPAIYPGDEEMNRLKEKAVSRFSKPVRDYLKQDAFYVGIDQDGKVTTNPTEIGSDEAEQCLRTCEQFQLVVEVLLGKAGAAERLAETLQLA